MREAALAPATNRSAALVGLGDIQAMSRSPKLWFQVYRISPSGKCTFRNPFRDTRQRAEDWAERQQQMRTPAEVKDAICYEVEEVNPPPPEKPAARGMGKKRDSYKGRGR